MKKVLPLIASISLLCTVAFGQGGISLGNGISGTRFPIYAPEPSNPLVQILGNSVLSQPSGTTVYGGALLSGSRYVIEFWAGPQSAISFADLSLIVSTTFRTAANPASLPNGITFSQGVIIPGVLPGDRAKLGVKVWDTFSGLDFESAHIKGEGSLYLSNPLGGNLAGGPPIVPPNWVGESFSLIEVPEPSSMALAGIGAASLLIFRRRK